MKKILSICLTVVLLVCLATQAFADGTPTFAAGSAEAKPGETVEIPVLIENNPGIVALYVTVTFDTDVLQLEYAEDASLFPTGAVTFGGSYVTDTFRVLWEDGAGTANSTQNGTIAVLRFLVKEDAPIGESVINVGYSASSVLDIDLNEVDFDTRNGAVTVIPAEVGGWSFIEGSALYTDETYSGLKIVGGLEDSYPVITDYVETTGGWSFAVETNEFGLESTGAKLVIYDENMDVVEEYYAVVFGDINGDAVIDLTDVGLLADAMGYVLDKDLPWADYGLPDEYPQSFAADCNRDLNLDLTDMGMLLDHMGFIESIDQSQW